MVPPSSAALPVVPPRGVDSLWVHATNPNSESASPPHHRPLRASPSGSSASKDSSGVNEDQR